MCMSMSVLAMASHPSVLLLLLSSSAASGAFLSNLAPSSSHLIARAISPLASVADADVVDRVSERFGKDPPALSLVAPSKINLFLRILRKRDDGFHELASLFQTVSLMDTLDFWVEDADKAEPICSMEVSADSLGREGIPTDESNLVMRALALYASKTGETQRIHCRLHKGVPAQAGLGGGSGDAATALYAANRLCGYPVPDSTLIEWAGELGSDISFFLSRGTAYCTGRGELVEPVEPLPVTRCFLVKPADGLSTPAVFKELGLAPGEELNGADPLKLLADFQASVTDAPYTNDLEPPAFTVMPALQELRDDLAELGFPAVMMSGSGSTIFCIGSPRDDASDTWKDEISTKHNAEVFEESFCQRPADEKLWYGEA